MRSLCFRSPPTPNVIQLQTLVEPENPLLLPAARKSAASELDKSAIATARAMQRAGFWSCVAPSAPLLLETRRIKRFCSRLEVAFTATARFSACRRRRLIPSAASVRHARAAKQTLNFENVGARSRIRRRKEKLKGIGVSESRLVASHSIKRARGPSICALTLFAMLLISSSSSTPHMFASGVCLVNRT
jgi:hypothetical protein